MLKSILSRLTYANLMASVAVFIAIGGGAYAAGLAKNSIKSRHIKNAAVKSIDLAPASVNSDKVIDGSLLGKDFAHGQLPEGARGPAGATGDVGDTGPTGTDGQDGTDGSQDTGQQILTKLLSFDGNGSTLDADQVDGLDSSALGDVMSARVNISSGAPPNTFAPITGMYNATTPRTDVETGSPNRIVVAGDMFVKLTQAAGGAVAIQLLVDGTPTAVNCTVSSGTSCTSGTGSVSIPAGSSLVLRATESAGADANAVSATVGFRLSPA